MRSIRAEYIQTIQPESIREGEREHRQQHRLRKQTLILIQFTLRQNSEHESRTPKPEPLNPNP